MFLQRLKGKDVRSSPAGTAALYSRRMKMDSTEFAADEKSELRSFMLLSHGIQHADPNNLWANIKNV
jgi:hypothetical protein